MLHFTDRRLSIITAHDDVPGVSRDKSYIHPYVLTYQKRSQSKWMATGGGGGKDKKQEKMTVV